MTARRVLVMGDPRLLEVAAPVRELGTEALRSLVADLRDTMRAERGAGLAAPQIGVGLRVVVFGYEDDDVVPPTVLVNPVIEPLGDEMEEDWEGCLSVPGMRGRVPRHQRVRYRGVDPEGRRIDRQAEGFHARVVQHECDHLDGILYPRRIRDLRDFGFVEPLRDSGIITTLQPCDDPPGEE